MPGAGDRQPNRYALARRVLLDALEALRPHLECLILVGAQAIYLHVGDADLAIEPYTEDADLAVDPRLLQPLPPSLVNALTERGFRVGSNPGIFFGADDIEVDLLVPQALGGKGTRGARLGFHGKRAARITPGLEAAMLDHAPHTLRAFDPSDKREVIVQVAGPAALLISKLHKLMEREGTARLKPKDALDVFRLLRGTRGTALAATMRGLREDPMCQAALERAVGFLERAFRDAASEGPQWVGQACQPLEDPTMVAAQCAALVRELLQELLQKGIGHRTL